ncbi:MAG: hypothetical protein Q7K65_03635 [Candidatus Buchananbacteria bacterium]|nr:hypothetical protein [Candidatus Buchananbacteria bacterium]
MVLSTRAKKYFVCLVKGQDSQKLVIVFWDGGVGGKDQPAEGTRRQTAAMGLIGLLHNVHSRFHFADKATVQFGQNNPEKHFSSLHFLS